MHAAVRRRKSARDAREDELRRRRLDTTGVLHCSDATKTAYAQQRAGGAAANTSTRSMTKAQSSPSSTP
jgi:hypothetical protein